MTGEMYLKTVDEGAALIKASAALIEAQVRSLEDLLPRLRALSVVDPAEAARLNAIEVAATAFCDSAGDFLKAAEIDATARPDVMNEAFRKLREALNATGAANG